MFYYFQQNNSGGKYQVGAQVTRLVIIEADSALEANAIAKNNGIYFDGVEYGHDCECCGDRWYKCSEDDGSQTINLDKYHINNDDGCPKKSGQPLVYIYLKNKKRIVIHAEN